MAGFDYSRFAREMQRSAQDAAQRALRLIEQPIAERAIRVAREVVAETGPALLRSATEASARFRADFESAMPGNWDALTFPEIFDAVDLMAGTGWSLLWTPSAPTVKAILKAPNADARRAVLLGAEAEIVEDLDRLLAGIDRRELVGAHDAARESLEAYRSGYFKASQALTTTTFSTVLHEQLRENSHRKVRKRFIEADKQEAAIRDFRWVAVQRAVAKTLEEYQPATGTPERSDYNRNASAHRVKQPQYRQVNALSGLMLLVSVLVEVNELLKLN